jgi:hypothetical protein
VYQLFVHRAIVGRVCWQQVGGVDPKCAGQRQELMECDPLLARFDIGQRRPADAALSGDPLLGSVAFPAESAQGLAKLAVLRLDG